MFAFTLLALRWINVFYSKGVKAVETILPDQAVHFFFIDGSYGRGGGVRRGRGVGTTLGVGVGLTVGVGVGVAVAVAVAVGVEVAVDVGVAVAVDVAVGVGVGDAVDVGVGLGVVPTCTSNEPTSMRPLRIRQKTGPRWS